MKKAFFLFLLAVLLMTFCGCRMIRIEEEERKPLEYTVMGQGEIPRELLPLIEARKTGEFQMTYQSGEDFYLVKGYGRQMTGGYSIQVEELSRSDNAVFFHTKLLGPSEDSRGGEPSYPYIVVKTQYQKDPVQFEA